MLTPQKLNAWATTHEPSDKLIFKDGYWNQIIFVRDELTQSLAKSFEEYTSIQDDIQVISTHTSKSVSLPVFQLKLTDGTIFTMRYNFHDWKISVSSPCDVNADFLGLFQQDMVISSVSCEGFPAECVHGSFAKNKRQFTIELPAGYYHIFTFFWIYGHTVLGNRNKGGSGR